MKRVIVTVVMLTLVVILICFHYQKMSDIDKLVDETYIAVMTAYEDDDFQKISDKLSELKSVWDDDKTWIGITADTDQMEEIEISLLQSAKYAEIADKEDFIGEFVLFNQLIKHLSYYERITAESLL